MMKKHLFAVILLLPFMNLRSVVLAGDVKPYKLPQACIEYKVTGQMFNGSEVLYFDNYGAREARYSTHQVDMMGKKQTSESVVYREGSTVYTVNLKNNTGTKAENDIMKSMEGKDSDQCVVDLMEQMGGKKAGTGEVLGKTCDIWELSRMETKIWVWNGISLRTEASMSGMQMSVVATRISEAFDKGKLQRPKNIEYKDVGNQHPR